MVAELIGTKARYTILHDLANRMHRTCIRALNSPYSSNSNPVLKYSVADTGYR